MWKMTIYYDSDNVPQIFFRDTYIEAHELALSLAGKNYKREENKYTRYRKDKHYHSRTDSFILEEYNGD